eukprot:2258411-Pyramimonas_sp.AAC.1
METLERHACKEQTYAVGALQGFLQSALGPPGGASKVHPGNPRRSPNAPYPIPGTEHANPCKPTYHVAPYIGQRLPAEGIHNKKQRSGSHYTGQGY